MRGQCIHRKRTWIRRRAGHGRTHPRGQRRPILETLETRTLLATIQFLGGATLQGTLEATDASIPTQTTEIDHLSLDPGSGGQVQGLQAGPPLGSGINGDSANLIIYNYTKPSPYSVGPSPAIIAAFYIDSTTNPRPYPTSATVTLTGGTVQVVPGPSDKIGDPV
jgi:hypothetical protein